MQPFALQLSYRPELHIMKLWGSNSWHIREFLAGLGTAFFSVLNESFFSVLLKNAMFFCVLFEFLATHETQKNAAFFS